jgi:thioredoxin reductase (NADPH)
MIYFTITLGNGESIEAKSVLIATGSVPKSANINGEAEFFGKGVSTCATCDVFFYKNKDVAVIGGGDSAIEEAIYLAKTCKKVYLVHRRDEFRAAPSTIEHLHNTKNIELVLNVNCDEVLGDNMGVVGLKVSDKNTNKQKVLDVPGVFVFVGRDVINEIIKQDDGSYLCDINEGGEILTNLKMTTSIKGLFVAGDMREMAAKQVICAAGDGATAALSAISYVDSCDK